MEFSLNLEFKKYQLQTTQNLTIECFKLLQLQHNKIMTCRTNKKSCHKPFA